MLAPQVSRVKAEPRDFGFSFPFVNSAGNASQSDKVGAAVKLEENDLARLV
jgi:hypothetical protein